jgi:site-specific recombinase XerD
VEFFTAQIRNRNTRRAYGRAAAEFLAWCEQKHVLSVAAIQPTHVSGWIEAQTKAHAAPTAKQRLAALRHLLIGW